MVLSKDFEKLESTISQLHKLRKKQKLEEARQYIKTLDQKMRRRMNDASSPKFYQTQSRRNTVMSGIGNSLSMSHTLTDTLIESERTRLQPSSSESKCKDVKNTVLRRITTPISRAVSHFRDK